MIIGVGIDLIDIRRIERAIVRWGERLLARLFTVEEQRWAERLTVEPGARAAVYAKRFAVKEACAKALGRGFTGGILWRDLGVVNRTSGQPALHLTGQAAKRLADITPVGMVAQINVAISDEPPFAQALVIIWAAPPARDRESGQTSTSFPLGLSS